MLFGRRESAQSKPAVSLRYVIASVGVVLFISIPLGILLARWTDPWFFKLCTVIAQWLFD